MEETNEAKPERTPQPRWIGFVIIIGLVLFALTLWPTVRRLIPRLMGA